MPWASMTWRTCGSSLASASDCEETTYPLLELEQISGAQGVGLGNDGDQVDARAQLLHDLDVERLQGVARGADEVQAGVDAQVDLVGAARLLLLQHVRLVLVVEELDYGLPRVAVVHVVAEAGRVDDRQADLEELLLELGLCDFDLDRLVHLLVVAALVVGVVLDRRGEERVDEGGFAEARLAGDLCC
jgi:hypothetical protein